MYTHTATWREKKHSPSHMMQSSKTVLRTEKHVNGGYNFEVIEVAMAGYFL